MEQKTNLPGIFLMIAGVIATLAALAGIPINIMNFQQNPDMQQMGPGVGIAIAVGAGVIGLITGVIIILAGVKLRGLSSYGLVMTGTILALIPCCNSCCVLAVPAGVYALIVLMDPQVKASFR